MIARVAGERSSTLVRSPDDGGATTPAAKIADTLHSWARDADPGTLEQARRTARLPIIAGHVALMPDAHVGIGATVGSVIPTRDAVIPAAVGVDIGCGMVAAELDVTADHLPDDLGPLLRRIEQRVPAGVGKGHDGAAHRADRWMANHRPVTRLSQGQARKALTQLGTLGSGNHFVEVCLDERDHVWVVVHSGSRGIGNQLAPAMGDRTWLQDEAGRLVDEIPGAYKDIDQVMADQADLVEVRHTLRQVLNYKGT